MFSEKLKQLRKKAKLTQKEFALGFNVAQGTVGMWETGKREPDFTTINKLSNYFNVTADYLLDNEKPVAFSDDSRNSEFINLFSSLDEEKQSFVLSQMKLFAKDKQRKG